MIRELVIPFGPRFRGQPCGARKLISGADLGCLVGLIAVLR